MIYTNTTDCSTAIKGTGISGCKIDINYVTQFFLIEDGIELDKTDDTIDIATINNLIQSGHLVVLPEHNSYDNASGETVYEELPSGAKLPVRNGLYEFLPMYAKGNYLSNALASLSSKNWGLIMIDDDKEGKSRLWAEETTNGKIKGMDLNLVYAENRQLNDGSVSTKTPLRLQLSTRGTSAMRSRLSYIYSNDSVDFGSLNGVDDVSLSVLNTTSAGFSVKSVLSSDNSTLVSSNITVGNWKITDTSDDSDVVPTGITYTNGSYAITGVPAGTYTVRFYDKANSKDVIVSSNKYYESDTITVTLT